MAKPSKSRSRAAPPQPATRTGIPLWMTFLIVGFLVTVGITILAVSRSGPSGSGSGPSIATGELATRLTATGGTTDEQFDQGSAHVAAPTYAVDPPAGGDHVSVAAAPKIYTADAVPPDGTVVHAMEHGYVVVWYRPDLRGDDLTALREVFDGYPRDVLLVPRASLAKTANPVVATAWHHRLLLPTVAKDPLLAFVATYRNKGPEAVPH